MAYTPVAGNTPTPSAPKPYTSGYTPVGNPATANKDEGGFSPLGFLGNIAEEAGDMVQGLTSLGGAIVHDVAHTVGDLADFDPGEADYVLDDIAKALPAALAQDYNTRYGISKFADGDIWGGIKAVLTGLYERPLSAIGDALIVGKAATLPAKAGLLGEAAGAKILGPGSMQAASLTGESSSIALKLSTNPVARLGQRKLYDLASYGGRMPGSAQGYVNTLSDIGEYNRAQTVINTAGDTPILRAPVSRALEKRSVSKALSLLHMNASDRSNAGFSQMYDLLSPDEVDNDAFVSGVMGVEAPALPDQTPSNAPVVGWNPAGEVAVPEGAVDVVAGLDPDAWRAAAGKYRGSLIRIEPSQRSPILSPHARTVEEANRAVLLTENMDDAANMAQDFARTVNGSVVSRQNYFGVAGEVDGASYDGIHYFIQTPSGQMFDVSIATPDLLDAQKAWSKMSLDADAAASRVAAKSAELEGAADEAQVVRIAAEVVDAEEELAAVQAFNAYTFDYTRRVMNGGEYDPTLAAIDRARNIVFNQATRDEIGHGLTYRKAWDRAFLPQRVNAWTAKMRDIESELAARFKSRAGTKPADMVDDVIAIVERHLGTNNPWTESVMRSLRDEVIEFESPDGLPVSLRTGEKTILSDGRVTTGARTNPDLAAKRVADKLRAVTRKPMVENGEFPGLDWRSLLQEQVASTLPIPQYYPHFKASRATGDVVMSQRGYRNEPTTLEAETGRMKKARGTLYEQGLIERDPLKAYEQLFRQIQGHVEFRDFLMTMVRKYGREVGPEELAAWNHRIQAETLVSEAGIDGLNDRSTFLTLKHENVMAGDTPEQASMKALEALDNAAMEGWEAGLGGKVWALPRHVRKTVDLAGKNYLPDGVNFWYDTAMGVWKASVLKLSPRWVANNTLGNLFYMGVHNPGALKYFTGQLTRRGAARAKAILGEGWNAAIERDFMHSEQLLPSAQRLGVRAERVGSQTGMRIAESPLQQKLPVRAVRKAADNIGDLNRWIEDAARRSVALDAIAKQKIRGVGAGFIRTNKLLERIAGDGIASEASYSNVISEINNTLGDYLTMSPIESQVIRRFIMPFYAFYRHTVKFVARMPFEHPLKVKVLEQIAEVDRQMNPYMPDYLLGSSQVMPGLYMRFSASNPLQAVTEAYWPQLTNPMLGLAIQRTTGTNPFGQPWYPPPGTVIETAGGDRFQILRDANGNFQGVRQMEGSWQPPLAEALISTASPHMGLLPMFDPWDRAFGRRIASLATGASFSSFDPVEAQYYALRDYQEAMGRGASTPSPQ